MIRLRVLGHQGPEPLGPLEPALPQAVVPYRLNTLDAELGRVLQRGAAIGGQLESLRPPPLPQRRSSSQLGAGRRVGRNSLGQTRTRTPRSSNRVLTTQPMAC
jgi:hypothetical protein